MPMCRKSNDELLHLFELRNAMIYTRKTVFLKRIWILGLIFQIAFGASAQEFTRQDSLRGSITPERDWWNLTNYDLNVRVNPADSSISGSNVISYQVLAERKIMQIDLQHPMRISSILQDGKRLSFKSVGNAHFIQLKKKQLKGSHQQLTIYFEGKPVVARKPPWEGGFSWQKDENGKDFIATSCQGIGASSWWPCKDHPQDEPDSVQIHIGIPTQLGLTAVSNGRLSAIDSTATWKTFHWKVVNPINAYAINLNIGDYVQFGETFAGEKGDLTCSYYILKSHLAAAKGQFKQVPMMLEAFEHWFGPYPFYEDGYKLVEVPYLGMEHQSSVTYGNEFKNGYLQKDLSKTGWGLNFDFIIIHESGHEWFANSITNQDVADMWIHESFTSYSENLYLDYHFGKKASAEYVIGTRERILNDKPMIGNYHVNNEGSGDMYYKGANMLHTLRFWLNDDEKWRTILRKMNVQFYHQTVTSAQIEQFLAVETGLDLTAFFNQYLRQAELPVFEYKFEKNVLHYRWKTAVADFQMPIQLRVNGVEMTFKPTTQWKRWDQKLPIEEVQINPNYCVVVQHITN